MFRNKKELELFVEELPVFERPKQRLEQYPTDAGLVATAVWDAHMRGLLVDVVDLGCGTGRFALAAAAMGARHVLCIDVDVEALKIARRTAEEVGASAVDFLNADATKIELRRRFRAAFQNPPFGIWTPRGTDIAFLMAALRLADVVYTIHKLPTLEYVVGRVAELGFELKVLEKAVINIKPMYRHHRKRLHKVEVFLAFVSRRA
ncbi:MULTISPECIES: METTL5 family protein [Pyrobaculum]|uniref:Methyltransferase n=3 Tax=Pyrobaculum TaxID=2276 RepID=A4WMX8_PYRAR|nr:METTL5 family protein [Pyrobaculum arsenaticum]ABP51745.1 methyltransferase [Pyrobaculum arsenaticum DSM 13514]MCY0890061.1 METTL5 family protein [Pyrobaculum arsenaticum]NYR16064.1 methyltransferase domain-containing protein [Pyrobaculum arsenaticum]